MRLELIRDLTKFQSIASEWDKLLSISQANNLFLTWEWMDAWLTNNKYSNQSLYIYAMYDDSDALVGLAPFYLAKIKLLNTLDYITLRMIGDLESGSEYPSIIAKPGLERKFSQLVCDNLNSGNKNWDCLWLPRCSGWDPAIKTFVEELSKAPGLNFNSRESLFSSFELGASYDDYLAMHSRNRRNTLRRLEKKIDSIEGLSIEMCQNEKDVPRYLSELFRLHQLRWQEKGESGSFTHRPALRRFYEQFAPLALKRGWLRLTLLSHQGDPKAAQIGYVYKNCYHQMQEGFDPEFNESIGNYLRIKTIKTFIEEGVNCYDFLGGMTEHKRRWKAEPRIGFDLFVWNKKLKNLPFSIRPIWPSGRYIDEIIQLN